MSAKEYEDAVLQKRLDALYQKYPSGRDTLKIWKLDELERVLSLPHKAAQPGQLRIVSPEREYGADRAKGRVFLFQKPVAVKPVSPAQMEALKPQISSFHDQVLARVGIATDEVFFKRTDLMVGQASTDPSRGAQKKTQPVVHGVRTYVLRAIDGIQVDGSSVSVVSQGADRVELLDAYWPPVIFAPDAKTVKVRNRNEVQDAIAARTRELAQGGKATLKMAMVLRRVQVGDQSYYVPAMKVGMRTEGEGEGVIFYEPLTNQPLTESKGASDTPSGGRD